QHLVGDTEDRRVHAEAEREGHDHAEAVSGAATKAARDRARVLREAVEAIAPGDPAMAAQRAGEQRRAPGVHISEPAQRLTSRLGRTQARGDQVIHAPLPTRLDL